MTTQTAVSILSCLECFDEQWIHGEEGVLNHIDRRRAITEARKSAVQLTKADKLALEKRLQTINFELSNEQSYEDTLRLQLTAYAIIHFLIEKHGRESTWTILTFIQCEKFIEIYEGATIK